MPRKSTFVVLWEWLTGRRGGDPSASNDRVVAEVSSDLDALRAQSVDAADRARVARHGMEVLARCGPFRDVPGYVRFLLASARAASCAGLLADVPSFLRAGLARVATNDEAAAAIQEVLDELDPVAAAIRDGRVAGPRLTPREKRELEALLARLRAIEHEPAEAAPPP